jgi:hypothetical protein
MVRPKGKNRLHLEAEAIDRWTGGYLYAWILTAEFMSCDSSSSTVEGRTCHSTEV